MVSCTADHDYEFVEVEDDVVLSIFKTIDSLKLGIVASSPSFELSLKNPLDA